MGSMRPGNETSMHYSDGGVPANPSGPSYGQQAYGTAAMPDNYQTYGGPAQYQTHGGPTQYQTHGGPTQYQTHGGPAQYQTPSMFSPQHQTPVNTQWQSDMFNNQNNNQQVNGHC